MSEIVLGREGSNHRMPDPKTGALPLGDDPIFIAFPSYRFSVARATGVQVNLETSRICPHRACHVRFFNSPRADAAGPVGQENRLLHECCFSKSTLQR